MKNGESKIFTAYKIGNLELKNRIIKAGCFEGMSQNGGVTDELMEHHEKMAAGGVAMTTVAYCSVSEDGRAYAHEMWMREELVHDLQHLTTSVHEQGAKASIQLGHCGYFASRQVIGKRPLGASAKFNLFRLSFARTMRKQDIEEKTRDFIKATKIAVKAGFDAVEIHAGHGYLLSQFISPFTNKRNDEFGGSMENRMRFPTEIIKGIRKELGPGFPILVKTNLRDGMKGGLELEEAIEVARAFEQAGASAIIPSSGFTSKKPFLMLRGNVPVAEMVTNQSNFLKKIGLALFGKTMVQTFPYEPLFHLAEARALKEALTIPVIYIGGIKIPAHINKALHSGFDFVQVGRALIHDNDFVNNIRLGINPGEQCDTCNRCVAAMDAGGVFCVSKKTGYKR